MAKNYQGELFIIHGDKDLVISHKFSQELFKSIQNKNKNYLLVAGKGYNSIWSASIIKETITNFITTKYT